jgi:hypothetical protein
VVVVSTVGAVQDDEHEDASQDLERQSSSQQQQQQRQQQQQTHAGASIGVGATLELSGLSWDQLLLLSRRRRSGTITDSTAIEECNRCLGADPSSLRRLSVEVKGRTFWLSVEVMCMVDVRA